MNSMMSRMSQRQFLEREGFEEEDDMFREEAIQEEISIQEAAKSGNEEALETILKQGSNLTVATLSPNMMMQTRS